MESETQVTGKEQAAAEEEKPMNIMVAIDESDDSFSSLRWALDTIIKRPSQILTVVHVMEPMPRYAFPGGQVVESASKAQQDNAAKLLSRASEQCKEKSVNAKTLILEGDPKDTICSAVEEMNVNLLIVGSRGLGQIKRAFLGSVSDYCVHHAKCAVLVVRQPKRTT